MDEDYKRPIKLENSTNCGSVFFEDKNIRDHVIYNMKQIVNTLQLIRNQHFENHRYTDIVHVDFTKNNKGIYEKTESRKLYGYQTSDYKTAQQSIGKSFSF